MDYHDILSLKNRITNQFKEKSLVFVQIKGEWFEAEVDRHVVSGLRCNVSKDQRLSCVINYLEVDNRVRMRTSYDDSIGDEMRRASAIQFSKHAEKYGKAQSIDKCGITHHLLESDDITYSNCSNSLQGDGKHEMAPSTVSRLSTTPLVLFKMMRSMPRERIMNIIAEGRVHKCGESVALLRPTIEKLPMCPDTILQGCAKATVSKCSRVPKLSKKDDATEKINAVSCVIELQKQKNTNKIFHETQRIDIQQVNKKRRNTKSYLRYERYKSARTVAEFFAKGGVEGDLRWDIRKGFIRIIPNESHPEHKSIASVSKVSQVESPLAKRNRKDLEAKFAERCHTNRRGLSLPCKSEPRLVHKANGDFNVSSASSRCKKEVISDNTIKSVLMPHQISLCDGKLLLERTELSF